MTHADPLGRSSRTVLEPASTTTTRQGDHHAPAPLTHGSPPSRFCFAVGLVAEATVFAQGVSPWLNAVDVLEDAFTGPLARGLSLIAIVIGGLMFAFGEGGSKKALAGIIFGLGMAMGAANFLTWLFS